MANWQWVGRIHTKLYTASGGRIGARLAGLPMLLLTTVGRRSGELRTTPLPYLLEGDNFVTVGSNGGAERDPAWWLNLQADPDARIQLRDRHCGVRAHRAVGDERARLWPRLKEFNPNWRRYERKTSRELPVVVLTPKP